MPLNVSTEYTQTLLAGLKGVQLATSFLRDRYFKTNDATDVFNTEDVLMDYKDGNRKIAPFILEGGKSVEGDGFRTVRYEPPRIAPKMTLTIDRLKKRGFGEAIQSGLTPAERALAMNLEDLQDMDKRITRREEELCAQALLNNKLEMVHQNSETDTGTTTKTIKFYDGDSNPQSYTTAHYWDAAGANIIDDLFEMANVMLQRGRAVSDLILGTSAYSAFIKNETVQKFLDNRRYEVGAVNPGEIQNGAFLAGFINANGIRLNIYSYPETYEADDGTVKSFIPAGTAIITAPDCGRTLYGCVTQLESDGDGVEDFYSYPGKRVPKYISDIRADKRELILSAKPIVVPNATYGWITLKDAVTPTEDSDSSSD